MLKLKGNSDLQQNARFRVTVSGLGVMPRSYQVQPDVIRRRTSCACGGTCPQCRSKSAASISGYTVSKPGDHYEHEADRVADHVLGMPGTLEHTGVRQTPKDDAGAVDAPKSNILDKPLAMDDKRLLNGAGRSLSENERRFFEPRFGHDFSRVRIHDDAESGEISRQINADAFTLGNHIAFSAGQYVPETASGRRILAHELTHVVQQRPQMQRNVSRTERTPTVRNILPENTIAGAWQIVKSPRRRTMPDPLVPGGLTDEQLLLAGFREICPLATLSSGEISVPLTGSVTGSRQQGCRCLRDIERYLPTLKTSTPPATVQVEPHGWSSTQPAADPVWVKVRHPDDPFSWGYWTNVAEQSPYEHRHQKPFWQTLGHEICGHVWTYVNTRGPNQHSGGRGNNPRDHDPAIEQENLLAAEHGVLPAEQRGFQHEQGDRPATRHAGESFIGATVNGFAHGATTLTNTNATSVIGSAASTAGQFPVFIELEGSAHANEGGQTLAVNRARAVMNAMIVNGISLTFTPRRSTQTANRFRVLPGKVAAGNSQQGIASPGRKVEVYLFHNPRSTQHDLLPAKVYFDSNRAVVRGISYGVLDAVAAFLSANPTLTVELIGRADSVGRASYNLALAQLRAEAVAQELLRRGVNATQIRNVTSQGETNAVAQSSATRWQDRHVEIRA